MPPEPALSHSFQIYTPNCPNPLDPLSNLSLTRAGWGRSTCSNSIHCIPNPMSETLRIWTRMWRGPMVGEKVRRRLVCCDLWVNECWWWRISKVSHVRCLGGQLAPYDCTYTSPSWALHAPVPTIPNSNGPPHLQCWVTSATPLCYALLVWEFLRSV